MDAEQEHKLWSRAGASGRHATKPLYLQVRDALAERIVSGIWKPGMVIPSEVDLAREFNVSAGTMRKALDLLEAERALWRRPGRGAFIADEEDRGSERLRFSSIRDSGGNFVEKESRIVGLRIEETENDGRRDDLLSLQTEKTYRVRQVWVHDGHPFMADEAWLPTDLFPGFEKRGLQSYRIEKLAQEHGILLGRSRERVTFGFPPSWAANLLVISQTTGVLILDRLLVGLDGRAVEARRAYCNLEGGLHFSAERV